MAAWSSTVCKTLFDQLREDFHQTYDPTCTLTFSFNEICLTGKLRVILTGVKKPLTLFA